MAEDKSSFWNEFIIKTDCTRTLYYKHSLAS